MDHIYHHLEYEQHEIDIMKPGRTFKVLMPGSKVTPGGSNTFETLTYDSKKRKASSSDEYVEEGGFLVKRVKVIDLTNE